MNQNSLADFRMPPNPIVSGAYAYRGDPRSGELLTLRAERAELLAEIEVLTAEIARQRRLITAALVVMAVATALWVVAMLLWAM